MNTLMLFLLHVHVWIYVGPWLICIEKDVDSANQGLVTEHDKS